MSKFEAFRVFVLYFSLRFGARGVEAGRPSSICFARGVQAGSLSATSRAFVLVFVPFVRSGMVLYFWCNFSGFIGSLDL